MPISFVRKRKSYGINHLKGWIVVVMLLTTSSLTAGGPWAEGKFNGYAETSYVYAFSSWLSNSTFQMYLEFGLTDRLTFKTIIPFKFISTEKNVDGKYNSLPVGKLGGASNIIFGGKYTLINKKGLLSLGMDISSKTSKSEPEKGLRTGYEKWNIKPIIATGMGLKNGYFYGELYADIGTNGYSENFGFIFDLGYKANTRVWIGIYSQYVRSFNNGDFSLTDNPTFSDTGLYIDKEHYFTIGPKISVELYNGFGINAAIFRDFGVSGNGGTLTVKTGIFMDW